MIGQFVDRPGRRAVDAQTPHDRFAFPFRTGSDLDLALHAVHFGKDRETAAGTDADHISQNGAA